MSPSTRRHIFLLVLGLACLYGVVFAGCAMPRYEWYPSPEGPMDYYRWEQITQEEAPIILGSTVAAAGGARVIRAREGWIRPGDKHLRTGEVATKTFTGKLCIVLSVMSEEEAQRTPSRYDDLDIATHEIDRHCRAGLDHNLVRG